MSHETLLSLLNRKDELEKQIEQHGMVLKANKIGMNEPLIDGEEFPLPNIDIVSVRKARRAINYLQNDRAVLLKEIEKEMALLFEKGRSTVSSEVPACQPMEVDNSNDAVSPSLEPFAVVERVEPGQLADRMGVQIRDKILQIGTLTSQNFKALNQIQTVISNSQGRMLRFVIRKASTGKDVTLDMDFSAEGTRLGIFAKPLNT
uniref:Nas2 N-terminal domain-containing protein n=1 Tax=Anopheles stephensi TaxID=30069 RepID=A0A182Y4X8_ANOST